MKLFLINKPVAKACVVIISIAKPPIVHDKHLYSALFCFMRNRKKLFRIKIKICSFPVIYEYRALLVLIRTSYKVFPVKIMQISRHRAKSRSRVCHHHLRCLKLLVRLKPPLKILRMNTHENSQAVKLIFLNLCKKISRIYKAKSIHMSCIL